MAGKSNYLENRLIDWKRGQAFPACPTSYIALLTSTRGPRENLNGQAVALNDTMTATANDGRVHYYKVTTAGQLAVAQGALYAGIANEVVNDGTAVLKEQDDELDAVNPAARVEPVGASYQRVKSCAGAGPNQLTDWKSTQGDNAVSIEGSSGSTSNTNIVQFPVPSTPGWGFVWGFAEYDALNLGNLLYWGPLTTVQTVAPGNTVSFQPNQITITEG
jgi:hypothetical protein